MNQLHRDFSKYSCFAFEGIMNFISIINTALDMIIYVYDKHHSNYRSSIYNKSSHYSCFYQKSQHSVDIIHYRINIDLTDWIIYFVFYPSVPSNNRTVLSIIKLFTECNWMYCMIVYHNNAFEFSDVEAIRHIYIIL